MHVCTSSISNRILILFIRHLRVYCCYIHEILSSTDEISLEGVTVHANLEKALGRTGWGIFRGMMTLWSLSHFCTKKIKILIVQYAVITEQTSSPRAFSHLSAFKENLRCNSLLLSLFQSHIFSVLLSFSPQCSFHTNCRDGGSLHQLGAPRLDEFSGQPVLPARTGEKDLFPGWSWNNICRLRTAELIRRLTE